MNCFQSTAISILFRTFLPFAMAINLAACGGGASDSNASADPGIAPTRETVIFRCNPLCPPPPPRYAAASIVGLTTSGLVLDINNAMVPVAANTTGITLGPYLAAYTVTVQIQPVDLSCSITQSWNLNVPITVSCSSYPRNSWAWVSGANLANGAAMYGTEGTAAASNTPGARDGASTWTDAWGNLWLFGGEGKDGSGISGDLNDLWKFNTRTSQWEWMSGVSSLAPGPAYGNYGSMGIAATTNVPGGRQSAASAGKGCALWLFGGYGASSTSAGIPLNDLWQYEYCGPTGRPLAQGVWAWMSGSSTGSTGPGVYGQIGLPENLGSGPGSRSDSSAWTDASGNFWLFGGNGYDANGTLGMLNDLWMFNPSTRLWTWVAGSNVVNGPSSYGTRGVAVGTSTPGPRYGAANWTDTSGNFWLFGGYGIDGSNKWSGALNDLWKFDPNARLWTWVAGSNASRMASIYGTQGLAASANVPGGRAWALGWTDASGITWILGGMGVSGAGELNNDLWKFDPASGMWTWISGAKTANSWGSYGTEGLASTVNAPGARYRAGRWVDLSGNFWLLGGIGYDSAGNFGPLNDLWENPL